MSYYTSLTARSEHFQFGGYRVVGQGGNRTGAEIAGQHEDLRQPFYQIGDLQGFPYVRAYADDTVVPQERGVAITQSRVCFLG